MSLFFQLIQASKLHLYLNQSFSFPTWINPVLLQLLLINDSSFCMTQLSPLPPRSPLWCPQAQVTPCISCSCSVQHFFCWQRWSQQEWWKARLWSSQLFHFPAIRNNWEVLPCLSFFICKMGSVISISPGHLRFVAHTTSSAMLDPFPSLIHKATTALAEKSGFWSCLCH